MRRRLPQDARSRHRPQHVQQGRHRCARLVVSVARWRPDRLRQVSQRLGEEHALHPQCAHRRRPARRDPLHAVLRGGVEPRRHRLLLQPLPRPNHRSGRRGELPHARVFPPGRHKVRGRPLRMGQGSALRRRTQAIRIERPRVRPAQLLPRPRGKRAVFQAA